MSKARVVITAVVVEGRSVSEVAKTYRVARSWVYALLARYQAEGDTAFGARSRRPHSSPNATSVATAELILRLRDELTVAGLDGGADTIRWHLEHDHQIVVSRTTIHRILVRHGLIVPAPKKRPKSSYIRFQAAFPNECWQSDFTHWRLADGTDVEILSWLDDHSRKALRISAHVRVTGRIVVREFRAACTEHGTPQSTLTDNGMVFTTRLSGGKGGRNGFETELRARGVSQKNSRPNHPTTCGKIERFQQTLKRWLAQQPAATSISELQAQLDLFLEIYNTKRPHRSLERRATPDTIYRTLPKAAPGRRDDDTHYRIRHDRIDDGGTVTLRHNGRLHHIGIGRTHARTHVILLIDDLHVRVIDAATGELLRDLTIDPSRDYQPTGRPPGPTRTPNKKPEPS